MIFPPLSYTTFDGPFTSAVLSAVLWATAYQKSNPKAVQCAPLGSRVSLAVESRHTGVTSPGSWIVSASATVVADTTALGISRADISWAVNGQERSPLLLKCRLAACLTSALVEAAILGNALGACWTHHPCTIHITELVCS